MSPTLARLAVLDMKTDGCSDYGCVSFSQVRIVTAAGKVVFESDVFHGTTWLDAGDVNGDGSDEFLCCTSSPECDVLSLRDGAVVRDHFDVESGC